MFSFLPLTKANWDDFVKLFGVKGACGGCWCMNWRLSAADYNRLKGDGNKKAMREVVKKSLPGIIAYEKKESVGWCAIAPRSAYIRLERSKVLKPVDDKEVWSVTCFFIKKEFRRKGLSSQLLRAAVDFALSEGALIVEGYPVDTNPLQSEKLPDVFAWTGLPNTFLKAGFKEVARRSATRPIMRFYKS